MEGTGEKYRALVEAGCCLRRVAEPPNVVLSRLSPWQLVLQSGLSIQSQISDTRRSCRFSADHQYGIVF